MCPPEGISATLLIRLTNMDIKNLIKVNSAIPQDTAIITNVEEPYKITMEDLAAELGTTTALNSTNSTELLETTNRIPQAKPKGTFLQQRYNLFATPLVNIYIQGVLPVPISKDIRHYLKEAKVKANGHPYNKADPAYLAQLTQTLSVEKEFLFSTEHKERHLQIVSSINERVSIDPTKCVSRNALVETLDKYENDLADFLVENGYSSPEEYLAANNKSTTIPLCSSDLLKAHIDF